MPGHLVWKSKRNRYRATSAEGSKIEITERDRHVFYRRITFSTGEVAHGIADGTAVILRSSNPKRAAEQVLRTLQSEAEGYVMRFETTRVVDPTEANEAIKRMDDDEWGRRLEMWRAKNPSARRRSKRVGSREPITAATRKAPPFERSVACVLALDTNRINARGHLENMNRIERWNAEGVIDIHLPQVVYGEATADGHVARTRKAQSYAVILPFAATPVELQQFQRIERAVFPDGPRTDRDRRDVEAVFTADKYGAILVTADGASNRQRGILGAMTELKALGIRVMTDAAACVLVEGLIRSRDERIRAAARETGRPVPPWVGTD